MSAVAMDAPTYGSPVRKVVDNIYSMRLSNDVDRSDPVNLSSLGVVVTAIVPDVFSLRAFDPEKPITRILPGQFRNELCVLIPDPGISPEGFHDVVITEISANPDWRTSRLIPIHVTSLRRRWPRILFCTMHKRQEEMEKRRSCRDWPEREIRQRHPGRSPQCHEYVTPALDI